MMIGEIEPKTVSVKKFCKAERGSRMATKKCTLDELEPGMILDRTVLTDTGATLMDAGTVLTARHIDILKNRFSDGYMSFFINSAIMDEDLQALFMGGDTSKVEPEAAVIDPRYKSLYQEVMDDMRLLIEQKRKYNVLDLELIGNFLADKKLDELCDGARAVSQIHSMKREGDYLLNHSIHVAILAGLMGRWLRWPRADRERLLLAGLLHDIGMLEVSDEIRDKKGSLNDADRAIIEKHPKYGCEMLMQSGLKKETDILSGVFQHHERLDGSGYPEHLKDKEIYTYGRILAILDEYDSVAASSGSVNHPSPFEIFDKLSADIMEGKLDAEYGILFIKNVCHALVGTWVRLTDGQKARIVYIDQSRTSALPIVETERGDFWDIATKRDVKIKEFLTIDEISGN